MSSLAAAFKFLTLWRSFSIAEPSPAAIGNSAIFFPLVGLVLGLLLALANFLLTPYLHPEILSVGLIAVLVAATGGRHLDGLRRTFSDRAEFASRYGGNEESIGYAALVLLVLFKVAAADSLDDKLAVGLLVAPILARWALVLFLYGDSSRFEETPRLIAAQVTLWQLFLTTGAAVGLTVYLLGRNGLWIGLGLSVFTLLARNLLYRRRGMLSRDHIDAIVEMGEAITLVLLASL